MLVDNIFLKTLPTRNILEKYIGWGASKDESGMPM